MKQAFLFGAIISIFATNAFAVSSTVTSKDYVDDLVATKQAKIPAAGATGVGAGETIITYTGAAGTIGERGIYNDATSYDATTDADKIITASALNGAVSNISTTTTSKLTCVDSPTCNLWTITEQTAYGNSGGGGGINIEEFLNAVLYGEWVDDCGIEGGWNHACDGSDVSTTYEYNDKTFKIVMDAAVAPAPGQIVAHSCSGRGSCYCRLASPDIPNPQWIVVGGGWAMNCDDSIDCPSFCNGSLTNEDFVRRLFGLQQ